MTGTSLEAFQDELRGSGTYVTPANGVVRRRSGFWATLRLSLAVAHVFPMSALFEAFYALTVKRWAGFCFSAIRGTERLGMKVSFRGWANRAAVKGPVIYLCNHSSTYETIALPPALLAFGPLKTVAKASLAHLPALERAAVKVGVVPLGRVSPMQDLKSLFAAGERFVGEGYSFLIFPQGTRSPVLERRRFSSIGAKLAEHCGVPLVPIACDTRLMPTRTRGILSRVFKDFGTVDTSRDVVFECGPAIPCTNAREMHQASFDWIADRLSAWGMPVERNKREITQ